MRKLTCLVYTVSHCETLKLKHFHKLEELVYSVINIIQYLIYISILPLEF
jgi:hypothetical protein